MIINRSKSGVMCLNKSTKFANNDAFGFPVVDSYKYLGFNTQGKDNTLLHMKMIRRKVFTVLSKIRPASQQMP